MQAQVIVKELRRIDRAVIQNNSIIIPVEQSNQPFHEMISIDLTNLEQIKVYKTSIHRTRAYNSFKQPMLCRIIGKYLYGVSAYNELGPEQWSLGLSKIALKLFRPSSDGMLTDVSSLSETMQVSPDRGGYELTPVRKEMSYQFATLPPSEDSPQNFVSVTYDYTVNTDGSISLYVLGRENLTVWHLVDVPGATWKKIRELPSLFVGGFTVVEKGGITLLMTASGNIYDVSGMHMSRANPSDKQLIEPDEKDSDDSLFLENAEQGEYWIVSTKKGTEGKPVVAKARSLKAGKIEDVILPSNIATALNTALKVKAKDTPKK